MQYKRGYKQYKSGTSSVKAKTFSANQAHHQYKRGCAVQTSRSLSFGTGGTAQKYFLINESLLLLIYLVKTVSSLLQVVNN